MEVNSIEEYIDSIRNFYNTEGTATVRKIFYRGQSSCDYKLIPAIGRGIWEGASEFENYIPFEQDLIQRIKIEYPEKFHDANPIDELALMQHYGLPTRLLDVTENPLVALYFACKNNSNKNGEVFVFNSGMNAEVYSSYDEEIMKRRNSVAFVRAKKYSNRQKIQQGLFMWFPDDLLNGIEKNENIYPYISGIIKVPKNRKEYFLEDLKMIGISEKTLFPDNLDKCCEELVDSITKDAYSA